MRIRPRNKSHLVKPRNLQQQTRSLSFSSLSGLSGLSETHFSLLLLLPCLVTEKKKRNKGEKKSRTCTDRRESESEPVSRCVAGRRERFTGGI